MRNFLDNPVLLVLLVLIIVLIFGANKLPGAARSLGRSMRIFKSEVREMKDEDKQSSAGSGSTPLEGRVVDPAPGEPADPDRPRSADSHRRDS